DGAWILRATARLPGSPLAQGLVLATGLLAAELLAALATPAARRLDFSWFRILALPLLSGYLLVALHAIVAAGSRALGELAPVLELDPAERARLARALRAPRRAVAWAAAAVGVGIPVGVALLLPEVRADALGGHPQLLAFGAMAALFWWLTAQGAALLLIQARRFHDLALSRLRVDLFDPASLAPFGRLAVRNALLVSGAVALGVALAATPDARAAWLLRIEVARGVGLLALFLAAGAACGLVALALPLLGVHRRLRREKEAALARLARALPRHDAATQAAAASEGGGATEPTRTAALLVVRDALEAAPEWPLDASMLRRFGLYALLPAASWLLRLALEEGLGRALG
ncbi:MAG: hypothetical protein R3263_06565, partial [Myxococcota bacterium]|nr:hypothetical protein [Myxococcota bacterium]